MPAAYSSVTPHCNHVIAFTLNYLQVPNSYKGVNILLISIFNSKYKSSYTTQFFKRSSYHLRNYELQNVLLELQNFTAEPYGITL